MRKGLNMKILWGKYGVKSDLRVTTYLPLLHEGTCLKYPVISKDKQLLNQPVFNEIFVYIFLSNFVMDQI